MTHIRSEGGPVHVEQKLRLYNYLIVLIISSASFGVNMVNGMMGTTFGQPSFLTYFGFIELTTTNTPLIGAINGIFFACAMIGCGVAAYSTHRFGRKKSMAIGLSIAIIGDALVAGSVHIAMLLVFRGVSGFASGFTMSAANLLQTELALPAHRGLLEGHMAIAISFGYFCASWVGVDFYFVDAGGAQWRGPWAICAAPLIAALVLLYWVPESPRWLCLQSRVEDASAVLKKLHGDGSAESDEFAEMEIRQISAQLVFEKENKVVWWKMFTTRKYRRRMLLTVVTMAMSQICGLIVVVNYGPIIYGSLGFDTVDQLCMSAGYVSFGTLLSFIGMFFIDKWGRVPMCIAGTIGQIVSLSIVTGLIANYAGTPNVLPNGFTVAFFYIFQGFFCFFVEGSSYTYITEIWPAEMRAQGTALGIATIYFVDMIFLEASLYAFATIGWKFYLVFVTLGVAFLIAFVFLAKETKRVPLEEIGRLFGDEVVAQDLSIIVRQESDEKVEHNVTTIERSA